MKRGPVEPSGHVSRKRLARAVLPVSIRKVAGPAGACEAFAQLRELRIGYVHSESGRATHRIAGGYGSVSELRQVLIEEVKPIVSPPHAVAD